MTPFDYDLLASAALEARATPSHYARLIVLDAVAEYQAAESAALKTFDALETEIADDRDEYASGDWGEN